MHFTGTIIFIHIIILVRFRLYHFCNNKDTLYSVTVQHHTYVSIYLCIYMYVYSSYTAEGVFVHLVSVTISLKTIYIHPHCGCVSNPTMQKVAVIYRGLIYTWDGWTLTVPCACRVNSTQSQSINTYPPHYKLLM